MPDKTYTYTEVQSHRSQSSCWVILYGVVYDVTSFLSSHPGGEKIILSLAGTDATEEYDPIHPPGILEESLPPSARLGVIDASTLPSSSPSNQQQGQGQAQAQAKGQAQAQNGQEEEITSIEDCLSLDDIEALATKKLSQKAWAYYFSASDDLYSKTLNNLVYRSILLRPRIFIDCTNVSLSTTFLGHTVSVPFYIAPAAMARLAHPSGEHGIAQACARYGAMQIISNNASQTPEQIIADAPPDQVFGWQLYVQTDRKKSEAMLRRINGLEKVKFVVLTLDAPVPGKREHDERTKNVGGGLPVTSAVKEGESEKGKKTGGGGGGVGKALFAGTAPDLTWDETLAWLRKHTSLPIVLKGIQTHEDAYLASLHAPQVKGIMLSNHGGRAMDGSSPSIHTLLEIRKYCPEVLQKVEVYVDGGIKRGTDVVKALCLGARGVGLGRAPLYALGAGGKEGVERMLEILKGEVETAMRLLGVENIGELGMRYVNARKVERDIYDGEDGLDGIGGSVKSRL